MLTRRGLGMVVAVALVLLFSPVSETQAQTNQGQDFWVAETTNNLTNASSFTIAIANPSGGVANITIAHDGSADINAAIPAGDLQQFGFPRRDVCINGAVNLGKNMVYHVTSDVDVVVYIFNPIDTVFSNDASLILPVPALGKNHRVGSFVNPNGNTRGSFLGVVANVDGTQIDVFQPGNAIAVQTATINTGEYWQFVNGNCGGFFDAVATDLTGYRVVTSEPATVFGGSECTSLGNSTGACDHIEEQIIPEEALAATYVACPTRTRPVGCDPNGPACAEDVFRYVATVNNTTITTSPNVGGGVLANAGDYIEITTDVPHVVTGDQPFYGYQYMVSQNSGSPAANTGDPAMLGMPPVDQYQFSYIFLTPATYAFDFINVAAPVGTTITLDGVDLTEDCVLVGTIGGVDYCCFGLQVADGVHTISGTQQFGLSVTGFDSFASYAYIGGLGLQPINAGCDTGGPYQQEECLPSGIQLDGTATCSDGSTPDILWSSSDGVTYDDPTVEDPLATTPGFGTFEVCMTVDCVDGDPVECCSSLTVSQQQEGCCEDPDPSTQGYWHRQCLGVSANEGGIDPGRNGRGPQSPTEPNFNPALMDCAFFALEDAGIFGTTTCDGMDADPPSDPCERAIKQLTALILNVCSGRLTDSCEVDLSAESCSSTNVGDLINELSVLINGGQCQQAHDCAAAVNEGTGLASGAGEAIIDRERQGNKPGGGRADRRL